MDIVYFPAVPREVFSFLPGVYASLGGCGFHRKIESCLTIEAQRRLPEAIGRLPVFLQYARPFHFRRLLRRKYESLRAGVRGQEVSRK